MGSASKEDLSADAAAKRAQLKALLAERVTAPSSAAKCSILPIREEGADPPLFCVLAGGADLPAYKRLAAEFGGPKMLGLQLAGATADDPVIRSIEKMAGLFLQELKKSRYAGPYVLCGHSIGAAIAFEIGQQLRQSGAQVALVIVIDQPGPDVRVTNRDWLYWQWAAISRLPWTRRWEYIVSGLRFKIATNRRLPSIIRKTFQYRKSPSTHADADKVSAADYRRKMTDAILGAIGTWKPQPCDHPVALLRAESGSPSLHTDPKGGWGCVALGGLQVFDIPGHHMNIFQSPNLGVLAERLAYLYNSAIDGQLRSEPVIGANATD